MKSEQIHYFLEAAELGSMLQVAQKHFMSQPAVSKAIAELEKELGVKLLHRSRQGIALTRAGEIARGTFLRIEAQLALLEESLAPYRGQTIHEEAVRISVCASPEMNATVIKTAMDHFRHTYPKAVFDIREYDFMEMTAVVARNPATFGVFSILEETLTMPAIQSLLQKHHLHHRVTIQGPLYVLLSENTPLAKKKAIALKDILRQPLVIYNSSPDECWHDLFLRQHGYTQQPVHTNSISYLTNLIETQGYMGFLLHQPNASEHLQQHTLAVRPVKEALQVVAGTVCHEDAHLSAPLQDFLHCLQECLQPQAH